MKKGILIFLSSLCFLTFPFSVAYSSTYYISWSTGNDSWDGTSPSTAWKSLDKVSQGPAGGYQPGDVIKFKKGDVWDLTDTLNQGPVSYSVAGLRIPKNGSPGNELSFISDDSYRVEPGAGKPIFDGKGVVHMGIYSSKNYIKIDGLEVRNLKNAGFPCSGIFIEHGGTNWIIRNMKIHRSYDGIFILGSHHLIEKNEIYDISHSGIYSGQDLEANSIVRENTVYNCNYNGIDIVGSQSGVNVGNRKWIIFRNYVFSCNDGIELSRADNNEIFSNITAYNALNSTKELGGILLAPDCDNNRVYNNTCFANRFGIAIQRTTGAGNVIINNLLADNYKAEVSAFSGKATFQNNLYFNSSDSRFIFDGVFCSTSWWTANVDNQALYPDPNFEDPSSPPLGLELASPSEAIDAGIDLGPDYQLDFKGVIRESPWDLGALESNSSDNEPPSPPTGVTIN
ncbi:MAG: right-handed parallel beta-helix repeat-containing protein [Candidatus Hodarchaeota archaeon]